MSIDYAEQLFQSVDTIIAARLNELNYDKTIVCTILDDSDKDAGKYTVTDGATTFDAFSDNTTYYKNTQVQVIVPNGDWTQQKTIIGRYIANDTAITYKPPTAGIVDLTGNLAFGYEEIRQLIARGNRKDEDGKYIPVFQEFAKHINNHYNVNIYDTLCIKADFRSWLGNYRIASGTYGIRVVINQGTNKQVICDLDSSKDMFGAVYDFVDWIPQEQAFKLPKDINTVNTLHMYFYHSGDFKYYNEQNEIQELVPLNDINAYNLFTYHVNIYLGSKDTGARIFTNDSLEYSPDDLEKTVYVVWNEVDKDGNSVQLDENTQIEWYIDNDKSALTYESRYNNLTTITFLCQKDLSFTQVQAKVKRAENDSSNVVTYNSNILRFEDLPEKSSKTPGANIKLRIVNRDNAQDAYPCYDYSNNVLDKADKINRILGVQWTSTKNNITEEFWKDAIYEWTCPVLKTKENEGTTDTQIASYNIDDIKPEQPSNADNMWHDVPNCYLSYKIASTYLDSRKNNTIKCKITLSEDVAYEGQNVLETEKTIIFSSHPVNDNGKEEPPDVRVKDIVDEEIGIPPDMYQGTVYDFITNQILDLEDDIAEKYATTIYVQAQEYLTQEKTFKALTNDGEAQGIFKDAEGNLYINGSYIATGILRSNNWSGKLTAPNGVVYQNEKDVQEALKKDPILAGGQWTLEATSGTYWDLNEGKLFASTFELNAWDENNNSGLYFNSAPSPTQDYFKIGNVEDGHFIEYYNDGSLTIQTNDKFTLNAWDDNEGIYINSKPGIQLPYFIAGNALTVKEGSLSGNNLIEVTPDRLLIASTYFILDAWTGGANGQDRYEGKGIYLNSDPKWYLNNIEISAEEAKDNKEAHQDMYFSIGNGQNWIQFNDEYGLKMNISNFVLHAFDDEYENDRKAGGIYFNSDPERSENDYWFVIGETNKDENGNISGQNNFIQMDGKGNFTIQTNDTFILNAWDNDGEKYQGIYINSKPGVDKNNNQLPYFRVGSANQDSSTNTDDLIGENLIQVDTTGVKIAANEFLLNAWDEENGGIFISSSYPSFLRMGNKENYLSYGLDNTNTLALEIKGVVYATRGQIGCLSILDNGSIYEGEYTDNNHFSLFDYENGQLYVAHLVSEDIHSSWIEDSFISQCNFNLQSSDEYEYEYNYLYIGNKNYDTTEPWIYSMYNTEAEWSATEGWGCYIEQGNVVFRYDDYLPGDGKIYMTLGIEYPDDYYALKIYDGYSIMIDEGFIDLSTCMTLGIQHPDDDYALKIYDGYSIIIYGGFINFSYIDWIGYNSSGEGLILSLDDEEHKLQWYWDSSEERYYLIGI